MNDSIPRPLITMLLSIGGASIGALIFYWGTPSTPESQAFVTSPEFITWFFLNEVLFAAYPLIVVMLWEPLNRLRNYFFPNFREILVSSLLFFVLYLFPHIAGTSIIQLQPLPLEYAKLKMLFLMLIGFVVAVLPLTIGILLTHAAIRDRFRKAVLTEHDMQRYTQLRDDLKRFLFGLGALLSIFTLTSAALRAVALAFGATVEANYPPVLLLLLGMYFSFLIALVYFPVHQALVFAGRRLLDTYFALPSPGSEGWAEKYTGRKQLEELLELEMSGTQRFVTSLTLLSPFVSGIFSLLGKM